MTLMNDVSGDPNASDFVETKEGASSLVMPGTGNHQRPKSAGVHRATPMESLLAKMDMWLLQQPEFIAILNAPRSTRREAASLLAKHITTYPMRGRNFGGFLD